MEKLGETMGKYFLTSFPVKRTQGILLGMNELVLCDVVFRLRKKINSFSDCNKVTSALHSWVP